METTGVFLKIDDMHVRDYNFVVAEKNYNFRVMFKTRENPDEILVEHLSLIVEKLREGAVKH